jgi:hypothetical protein
VIWKFLSTWLTLVAKSTRVKSISRSSRLISESRVDLSSRGNISDDNDDGCMMDIAHNL